MSGIDSKSFIKSDVAILIVTLIFYGITQAKINPGYSSGYSGIWMFFTFQALVQVLFQVGLILSAVKHQKMYTLSLRSGAFFFVLGMTLVLAFLGLFTFWMIFYFVFVEGSHFYLFNRGLQMEGDDSYEKCIDAQRESLLDY